MALAILSMVLIAATVVATQSFRLGQTARERTAIADAAQGQMEAVRAFRDNHTWNEFLYGGTPSDIYAGMLSAGTSTTGCNVVAPCMNMTAHAGATYVPVDGPMAGPFTTSYIELVVEPVAGANPNTIYVTVNYGFERLGGSQLSGHLKTTFTNVNLVMGTPAPTPPVCSAGVNDIMLMIDSSHSMSNDFPTSQSTFSRADQLRTVANSLIDNLNLSAGGNHLAIMKFNNSTTLLSPFTINAPALHVVMAAYDWENQYGTYFTDAFQGAGAVYAGASARPGVHQVMLFITDGALSDGPVPVPLPRYDSWASANAAATALAGSTLDLYPIGIAISSAGTASNLAGLSRNAGFYGDAQSPGALQAIVDSIAANYTCGP